MIISIDEFEAEVEYDFNPAVDGLHSYRNGDPGYPPEPEEINVTKLTIQIKEGDLAGQSLDIDLYKLSEDALDKIDQKISEYENNKKYEYFEED